MIKTANFLSDLEDSTEAVKKPDPLFDLILDEDLAHNTWPKKMTAIQAAGVLPLSCVCVRLY